MGQIASTSLLISNKDYGWDKGWKIKESRKLKCQKSLDEMEVRETRFRIVKTWRRQMDHKMKV